MLVPPADWPAAAPADPGRGDGLALLLVLLLPVVAVLLAVPLGPDCGVLPDTEAAEAALPELLLLLLAPGVADPKPCDTAAVSAAA